MRDVSDWAQGFALLWSERMDRLGSFLEAPDDRPANQLTDGPTNQHHADEREA
ncbi:hypothetical protein [Nocardioides renjunii]|nr:hypothetical protein [Nocardioides sp. S-34]WQQ22757.1 hypothetical protein SHK17_01985 [Nocardioides sp. S-34]